MYIRDKEAKRWSRGRNSRYLQPERISPRALEGFCTVVAGPRRWRTLRGMRERVRIEEHRQRLGVGAMRKSCPVRRVPRSPRSRSVQQFSGNRENELHMCNAHMHIYEYIGICTYICIYVYIEYVYLYTYICIYMYTCMYMYIHMYVWICIYVYIYGFSVYRYSMRHGSDSFSVRSEAVNARPH